MLTHAGRELTARHTVRVLSIAVLIATLLLTPAIALAQPTVPDPGPEAPSPASDQAPATADDAAASGETPGGEPDATPEGEPEVVPEGGPEAVEGGPEPSTTPESSQLFAAQADVATASGTVTITCSDESPPGGTGGPGSGTDCTSKIAALQAAGCTVGHSDTPAGPQDTLTVSGCPEGVDPGDVVDDPDPDDPQACDADQNPIPLADSRGLPPEFIETINATSQVLHMDVPKRDGFYTTAVWDELIVPTDALNSLQDVVEDALPNTGIGWLDDLLADEALKAVEDAVQGLIDDIDGLVEGDDNLVRGNGDIVVGRYLVRTEYSVKDGRIQDQYTVNSTPEYTVIGDLFSPIASESENDVVAAGGAELLAEHSVDVRLQLPFDVPSDVIDLPELRTESDVTIRNYVQFSDWTASSDGADAYTVLRLSRCPE